MNGNKGSTGRAPPDFTFRNNITLTINEANITPQPIRPVKVFDNEFLKSPLIKKPIKGKSGTK